MAVIRWNPWDELFGWTDDMERALVRPFKLNTLPLDVKQTDHEFIVEASVPGFGPEEVEVMVEDNVLTIKGTRKHEDEQKGEHYLRRERSMESVYRQITLPAEVNAEKIKAQFENGILKIDIPRTEKAQPKRITVTSTQPKAVEAKVTK